MSLINKHLVAWNTVFKIHENKYKVVGTVIKDKKIIKWLIRPLAGGKDFYKEVGELDRTLRKHKQENNHLLYDATL
jgi:hypothetical protein